MTVEELIERASRMTSTEVDHLRSRWFDRNLFRVNKARDSVLVVASAEELAEVARSLSGQVPSKTWRMVHETALALAFRDRISEEHFNTLYGPWASVMERA